jgi:transposase-like protein
MNMKQTKTYSPEQRAHALQQVASRGDQTIAQVADSCGVLKVTLKGWMRRAKRAASGTNSSKPASAYTPAEQLNALLETASMDEGALAAWCRFRGLFPHHLQAWRVALTAPRTDPSLALREAEMERDRLARELLRKDKALAEAAALLVLQKKFQAMFSEEGP